MFPTSLSGYGMTKDLDFPLSRDFIWSYEAKQIGWFLLW